MKSRIALLVLALVACSGSTGWAHPGHDHGPGGNNHGLAAGFFHPLFGLDHLLAMFAVGMLAAHLGGRALWVLPTAFIGAMALGGCLGFAVPLPGIEIGVALSVVALGVALAMGMKYPLVAAAIVCGLFGLLHGHAHGAELPDSASPLLYALGFVAATAGLHAAGIGAGLLVTRWQKYPVALRLAGAGISVAGLVILIKPLWA